MTKTKNNKNHLKKNWQLYLMLVLPITFFIIFKYIPMYGAQIAFRKYRAIDGIWGSQWVGFKYFHKFLVSHNFFSIIKNTLSLSVLQLILGFPAPIIVALALNTTLRSRFKKVVQFTIYAPHFLSVVVMCGLIIQFLDPRLGLVNKLISLIGIGPINFLGKPSLFNDVYVWTNIWQSTGWGTIIYLAALSNIDPNLHEAASIDGASRFQRVKYIDFPGILPTAITLLILNCGRIVRVGFQKVLLLQNSLNLQASEVIQTYTYRIGLASQMADFSYAAAIGIFTSVINLILIVSVNKISRKVNNHGIW
ncbi:MAG: ABC transporter permease subunit [Vallitalea sp.]|jgi:putative aldouronate transport system permease protein|nr:ABC transporter permease subunit [Vallitalea sp.]